MIRLVIGGLNPRLTSRRYRGSDHKAYKNPRKIVPSLGHDAYSPCEEKLNGGASQGLNRDSVLACIEEDNETRTVVAGPRWG